LRSWVWVIKRRTRSGSFCVHLVKTLSSSYLGSLRTFLNLSFIRIVSTGTRKILFFFNFPTHAQRHLNSRVAILCCKIGTRSWNLIISIKRQSLSFSQRVTLSFTEKFNVLRVILNKCRWYWIGRRWFLCRSVRIFFTKTDLRRRTEVNMSRWVTGRPGSCIRLSLFIFGTQSKTFAWSSLKLTSDVVLASYIEMRCTSDDIFCSFVRHPSSMGEGDVGTLRTNPLISTWSWLFFLSWGLGCEPVLPANNYSSFFFFAG